MPCTAQDVHVVSWREPRHAATQLALQATSSKRGSLGAGPIYVDSGANWRSPALAGQRLSSSGPLELDSRGCPVAHQRMAQVVGLVEQRLVSRGRLGRYTLEEVARHNHKDSGWVVVNGRVYDITHHVATHPGWTSGCGTSQLLAILRTLGTDCSDEVLTVHSARALAQFAPYLIGVLVDE